MKSHVKVAVIGGGVVGCSVLYHLTKLGWSDVILIERSELTSGSTWHAAGGFHTLNGDPNVAKLQAYTIELYKEIEEISGQSCGLHMTGGVMLAGTPERMDFLKVSNAKCRFLGIETEIISMEEAERHFPLMDKSHFVGALYNPYEGHLDPSGTTHAYAKAARVKGAEISLRNRVTDLQQRQDGTWDVVTEKGTIHAEHVVNAGGLWGREVGQMAGLELPLLAMEHMYLITEEMPEVLEINERSGAEVLHAIDFEGEIYMRQEGKGMLMGTYEKAGVPWSPKSTPWDFGHELLQPDIDRIAPSLEVGFKHFPAFERAGIKQIINGPFTFTPDGNPLVGPVRGLRNYWTACGVMAGFSQGGGVGLTLARWMIDGDPGIDAWGMDCARFGEWARPAYTHAKVRENYSRRFQITYPNEELPAARPVRTTPIYDRLKAANAVFGANYGTEQALWFAPEGEEPVERVCYGRSNAFPAVAAECQAVRENVGLTEVSQFAKYEVTGAGAEAWLDSLLTNTPPKIGRMVLAPMVNHQGKLIGDFTVARLGDERFMIFGSGGAESYHMRWFEQSLPADVSFRAHGLGLCGLAIAGPKARGLLQSLVDWDVSAEAFGFMDIVERDIGSIPAIIGRVSFTGDLGYEIWVRPEYMLPLYDALTTAGADFGLKLFGGRALRSLSLEKFYGSWATEFRPIYDPYEASLGPFVKLKDRDFIGHAALSAAREKNLTRKLIALAVDVDGVDPHADEPIWHNGEVVGWTTSGGYAHASATSVALGYVSSEFVDKTEQGAFAIEILGEHRPATILTTPLFDPERARMRG